MPKTIDVPVTLLEKMSRASQAFDELEDEMEDFLLAKDPQFLKKMRKARKDHVAGKTRPLASLKKELCIIQSSGKPDTPLKKARPLPY